MQSAGGTDAFLATYNGNGGWTRVAGGAADDAANAVDTDADGNPVFTGYFVNTVDFGGGPLVGSSAPSIFLVKYTATDGAHVWSKSFRSPTYPIFGGNGRAVAIHRDGSVALTGSITDDIDFGGGALGADYTADIFLAEFSPLVSTDGQNGFLGPSEMRERESSSIRLAISLQRRRDRCEPRRRAAQPGLVEQRVSRQVWFHGRGEPAARHRCANRHTDLHADPFARTPTRAPASNGTASGAITYYSNSQVVAGVGVNLTGSSPSA